MFGKLLSVHEYEIKIENLSKKVETSLIGVHIVFEDQYKIVGEITRIDVNTIECVLVGEFRQNKFESGITHKPSSNAKIRVVNTAEVVTLLGNQQIDSETNIYIGKSLIYEGFNITASINQLFSNHFAIIGNTGSGKSCTVSRVFQNLFYRTNYAPVNANMVLFDVYGEYHHAFEKINNTKECRYKILTTDINSTDETILTIPLAFLDVDDIALLLNVDNPAQIPIIEKALKYVYLFTEEEESVIGYKNNIIAKAILDILTSGREPGQIRDQVVAVLSAFNTRDINLDSPIVQPGYTRTLVQCLNLDQTGKINTIQLVIEYMEGFINDDLKLNRSMIPKKYSLKDLYNAFEFALISEGILKSDKVYDLNNILKVRLDSLMNGDYGRYFTDQNMSKQEYIHELFHNANNEKVQLLNFNLNYVDERFAKVLTKIFSKLFLNYAIQLDKNDNYSIQIILEEAHRYVQNDNDINVLGYNIFDRITKEGRKYGVVLGLITQRPSELSTTALSQCSNYVVLRMFHPDDIEIVKSITHSISESDVERLKAFGPGTALCFGTAFNIPSFAKIDPPNPYPNSFNAQVGTSWFKKKDNEKELNK